jgi:hypothetical protein
MQPSPTTRAALEAAISALEAERARIDGAIMALRPMLGTTSPAGIPIMGIALANASTGYQATQNGAPLDAEPRELTPYEVEAMPRDITVARRGPKPKQQPRRITNPTSDKHTPLTRKPMVEITPEQIAVMKQTWRDTGSFSDVSRAASAVPNAPEVSLYVAKKRITTWQIEGIL